MLDQVDNSGVCNVVAIMALNSPEYTKMDFFVKFGQFVVSHHTKGYLNHHKNNERNEALE